MGGRKIYILAAFFSLLLYSFGVMSGLFIEKSVAEHTESELRSLQRRLENLQLEYAYLSMIGGELSCDQLSSLTRETTERVWVLGRELDEDNPDFEELKMDYALLSTKAWILNSYVKERCAENVVVLYFYSVPCEKCIQQGQILDNLREEFRDRLLIFVLNADLDEPVVDMLKTAYSIDETPTIVIGGETYSGLIPAGDLVKIIYSSLNTSMEARGLSREKCTP
ncbi:MAG: thioredoxin family protein [Candidatus Altiarchaeales archaeon]|nr:thioredoxin family protein [Candidatus Altiarchaeales archaeon]